MTERKEMTREEIAELENLVGKASAMLRDARPMPPGISFLEGWIHRRDTRQCDWPMGKEPYGLEYGDYTEAMLHGGTTIAGNLKSLPVWGQVIAFRRLKREDAPWAERFKAADRAWGCTGS